MAKATHDLQLRLIEWKNWFAQGNGCNEYRDDALRLKTVRELCAQGADLDVIEARRTACIPSVFLSTKLINFFLSKGRDIDARDENGDTALNLAFRFRLDSKPRTLINYLLRRKADPNVMNNRGETPVFQLVRSYLGLGSNYDVESKIKVARSLHSADFTIRNCFGQTVIHVALKIYRKYHIPLVQFLLDGYPGNPDVPCLLYGETPLMLAASVEGADEICRVLIDKGSDIQARDLQGNTLLHYAANDSKTMKLFSTLVHEAKPGRIGPSAEMWNKMREMTCKSDSIFQQKVTEHMAQYPDEDYGSLDRIDLVTLNNAIPVRICDQFRIGNVSVHAVGPRYAGMSETEALQLISYVHCIAKVAIQCLRKWIEATGQNVVEMFDTYLDVCSMLGWIKEKGNKVPAKLRLANDSLIKTFIDLQPVDDEGNTLLHAAAATKDDPFIRDNILVSFLGCGASASVRNKAGFNAYQMVKLQDKECTDRMLGTLLEMAGQKGVHFDARNAYGESVAKIHPEPFARFLNLQCLCARILARNHVLYWDRDVPNQIREFIGSHVY